MSNQDKRAVLATVDERVARLFEVKPTLGKALDLNELATITNSHEGEHQQSRPDLKGGPGVRSAEGGSGVAGAPHTAQHTETGREESKRFAREVARWLGDREKEIGGQTLTVFSAPRFLGMLRDELDGSNVSSLRLEEGEYAQMPIKELRTHSALREAVGFDAD